MRTVCDIITMLTFFGELNFGAGPRYLPAMSLPVFAVVLGACDLSDADFVAIMLSFTVVQSMIFVSWRQRLTKSVSEAETIIKLPFAGRWWCSQGGPNGSVNQHAKSVAQRYAFDFCANSLIVRLFLHIQRKNRAFRAYGMAVYSPVDGVLVATKDGLPDGKPLVPVVKESQIAGNHVVIETTSGYLWLAHLQPGSIRHEPGDAVRAGDVVGTCGNSGNSTEPHLHVHMQDSPVLNEGRGIPIAFLGVHGKILRPVRGDRVN